MVKHVILWRLRRDHDEDDLMKKIAFCEEGFARLVGVIPGLLSIKLYTRPLPTSNCDLMLDAVFESEAAYSVYKSAPEHISVASVIRPLVEDRICMDCEM